MATTSWRPSSGYFKKLISKHIKKQSNISNQHKSLIQKKKKNVNLYILWT